MLTADQFSSPWSYLDAKREAFERDRMFTAVELQRLGWKLRDNHPVSGTWRARRWSKKDGTVLMSATSAAELVRLCRENFDKLKRDEERAKSREEKKKVREKERAEKKAAREATRREA